MSEVMRDERRSAGSLKVIAVIVLILGLAMLVYWAVFLLQSMPTGDIPILSETITALLALGFLILIVILANTGLLPRGIRQLYDFPYGDKVEYDRNVAFQ